MFKQTNETATAQANLSGCLARLTWMLLGNAVLGFCAIAITDNHEQFLATADLIFWAVVTALVVVRYVDIQRLNGMTASGEPATMTHWYRYVAILLPVASAVWIAAHAVAWRASPA